MKKNYIDILGYHIIKNDDDKILRKNAKKELTVSPMNNMYGDDIIKYKQYVDTDDELIIPRYYGIKKFGKVDMNFNPEKSTMDFKSTLRDYQIPITDKCIEHILKYGGGQLSVPCGRGKTVMAIYIAYKLGLKTLVLTHQSFLQDQWIERIKFFTGEDAGMIRQDIVRIENKNIVVGMVQSIGKRDYGDIFNRFGLIICDECHHYASKYFSQCLSKVGAQYTLGLSATLYRNDGLVRVVNWYLGDVAYKEKMKTNNQVVVKMLNFTSKNKLFKESTKMVKGVRLPNCTKMLGNLVDIKSRNSMLINIIDSLRKDPNRKILILSGRKLAHLPNLKKEVDALIKKDIDDGKILEDECKTYFYTGDCSQKERFEAEKNADIIFGTYHMAQEGLDIERLNTIILATPKKDVVQAVGRILRKVLNDGDIRPLIIDITDNLSIFPKQALVREKLYNQNDYAMQYYYLLEDAFISPKQYVELQGGNSDGICDMMPKDYDEILKVPPVEMIINNSSSDNEDEDEEKKNAKNQYQKKPKYIKKEEPDVFDVFDL